jgi:hypothetical protein
VTPSPGASLYADPRQNFVVQAYYDFLGRLPSAAELSAATGPVSTDAGRAAFLATLSTSDEWVTHVITGFYQDTLGRSPDAEGLAFWIGAARAGMPIATIAANFYASTEYYRNIGGNTATSWITDLYAKLMGRAPDPEGLAFWVATLARTGDRTGIALGFYQSTEKLTLRVDAIYLKFLHRHGEAGGVQFWIPNVAAAGDLVLAANFGGSAEYYALAQTAQFRP